MHLLLTTLASLVGCTTGEVALADGRYVYFRSSSNAPDLQEGITLEVAGEQVTAGYLDPVTAAPVEETYAGTRLTGIVTPAGSFDRWEVTYLLLEVDVLPLPLAAPDADGGTFLDLQNWEIEAPSGPPSLVPRYSDPNFVSIGATDYYSSVSFLLDSASDDAG